MARPWLETITRLRAARSLTCLGETTKQVTVRVFGDTLFEQTEFFLLNLLNPDNATVNDNLGQGTILDDDVAVSRSRSPTRA